MTTITDMLFITGIAFIFVHELDATRQGEWRFFFGRMGLADTVQYRLFAALHVPLFVVIIWQWADPGFQIAFDLFLIVHLGLHIALRKHPHINFDTWFSWVWIVGGGILGLAHLLLVMAR